MDKYSASEINPNLEDLNLCYRDQVSDINKENYFSNENENSKFPNGMTPNFTSLKSTRKSILKCLDPLNPFSSPTDSDHRSQQQLVPNENEEKCDIRTLTEKLDQSWDIMMMNEDNQQQHQTITGDDVSEHRQSILDSLHDNYLFCSNINRQSHNTNTYDSELLEVSLNDMPDNNVAVDNLLSISPMKRFVEQSVYDRLKKHHQKKEEEWKNMEKMYLNQIEKLKLENESKENLLKEKETELKEKEKNKQTSIDENDLIKKELKVFQLQYDTKLEEVEQLKAEIVTLSQEIITIATSAMEFEFVVDQYSDTINEMTQQFEQKVATLNSDNDNMITMLNTFVTKHNTSTIIISNLKQNEGILLEQISTNEEKIKQLETEIKVNGEELTFHRHCFERQLKKNEIKISMLENGEINLRAELELRIKERDQLKENLAKLLE